MNTSRLLLAGLAATLLLGGFMVGGFRHRFAVESPRDLAHRAIGDADPAGRVEAAARLASLAARRQSEDATMDTISCLKEVLTRGDRPEVRAAAIVGLARTEDRSVLPLLVAAIEDEDALVAGRAVAAAQHLLGVRYGVEERPFDREERRRLAAMARADMAALAGPGRAWWEAHTVQGATW